MALNSRCGLRRRHGAWPAVPGCRHETRTDNPPGHFVVMQIKTLLTAAWLGVVATAPLVGQPSLSPKAKADSAKTPAPLFGKKDLIAAGAFTVGMVAMFPFDERLAK